MTFRKDYDGRAIIENAEYVSATVLKRTLDSVSILVELHDGTNLLIQRTNPYENKYHYVVHTGIGVNQLAQQTKQTGNMAHSLLLEMRT